MADERSPDPVMDPSDAHYIHGTRPEEQRRLSVLNRLLNEASLRQMRVRSGEKILDVGSGLGQLTRELARAAGPAGRVIGIERDPEQMDEALRQAKADGEEGLVELRVGDAVDLPLADDEWGTFDVVHARFLLEHVPDPLAVVGAMIRAARPGGRIVLEDDDHDVLRFFPELPETRRLWEAYFRTYAKFGRDPYVGRRLVAMLHEAGATPSGNTWLFFGSCAGSPNFDPMVANFLGVLEGARESVLAAGELTDPEIEAGIEALRSWSERPDAALWYATCWAEARRH
jgi:ubiquinone/menaquinone biosynthesis C-methylase UbiE